MKKGEKYDNPYLNEVLFRINFSKILRLSGNDKSAAEEFRKQIFKEYPLTSIKKNYEVNIGLNLESEEFNQIDHANKIIWLFKNKEGNKTIELSDSYIILSYKKDAYTHFRCLLNDVLLILNSLQIYKPVNPKLIELRYINQISNKTMKELNECINEIYFNKELIELNKDNFVQDLGRLTTTEGKYLLNTQYGLFNPGYPNPNYNKDYILDFDCVYYNINDINQIESELKKMNHYIWNHFQSAITDKLKKEMGESK